MARCRDGTQFISHSPSATQHFPGTLTVHHQVDKTLFLPFQIIPCEYCLAPHVPVIPSKSITEVKMRGGSAFSSNARPEWYRASFIFPLGSKRHYFMKCKEVEAVLSFHLIATTVCILVTSLLTSVGQTRTH